MQEFGDEEITVRMLVPTPTITLTRRELALVCFSFASLGASIAALIGVLL